MSSSSNPPSFSTPSVETRKAGENHSMFALNGQELTTDIDKMNDSMKSKLAECFSENWKELANFFSLQKNKVDQIDKEQIEPLAKANRVLDYWITLCPHTYNVNSIKKKLRSIGRKDIISYVFGEDKEERSNQTETSVPKVESLSFHQIGLLANLLDPDYGWAEFANFLFQDDKEFLKKVEALQYDYAGGGNPVEKFLKLLLERKPLLTIKEFLLVCEKVKREDVILYAEKHFKDIDLVSKLDDTQLRKFAGVIRGNITPSDWADIACQFEFSKEDLRKIDRERLIPNSYSPTAKLFEKIQQSYPEIELQKLIIVCEQIRRIDVASKLREFLQTP